ncbi:MAG: hypothetical protein Q8Q23_00480 [bacterium]|nr:hypothetical protein [bacterium]
MISIPLPLNNLSMFFHLKARIIEEAWNECSTDDCRQVMNITKNKKQNNYHDYHTLMQDMIKKLNSGNIRSEGFQHAYTLLEALFITDDINCIQNIAQIFHRFPDNLRKLGIKLIIYRLQSLQYDLSGYEMPEYIKTWNEKKQKFNWSLTIA